MECANIQYINIFHLWYSIFNSIACGVGRIRHLVKQRVLTSDLTQRLVQEVRGKYLQETFQLFKRFEGFIS